MRSGSFTISAYKLKEGLELVLLLMLLKTPTWREEMEKKRTKLMEAYSNLIGDYPIDSMGIDVVKEELEMVLDQDLTEEDFYHIIQENAKVYRVFLIKYRADDHFSFMQFDDRKVGEIAVEVKEGDEAIINGIKYY